MSETFRLRARWVVPITSDPIENAEVVIEDGLIAAVQRIPISGGPAPDVWDFGEAVLMPGLVNVHAHIDYTVMRGLLEDLPFFTWIRELTARKEALDEEDWIASATMGAAEGVAGGVTTLGDCTDSGGALRGALALRLRGVIFQEVFSVDADQPVEEVVRDLDAKVQSHKMASAGSRLRIGISPHAPYTVMPDAIRALAQYAKSRNLPTCIHCSESQAEVEQIRRGTGIIAERFTERDLQWLTPPPGSTAVAYLDSLGALNSSTLLVHGVQLSASDRNIIERTGVAWAHCPKSNAKLGNGIAPLGLLRQSYPTGRMRVGLGSDSVASNNTMDLFEEMRFAVLAQRAARRTHEAMTAKEALEMATIGGARALGMDRDIGSLEPGKQADVIAVRTDNLASLPCFDPVSSLVYSGSARDVSMTMIGGEIVYDRREFPSADLEGTQQRFCEAACKLADWHGES